MKNKSNEHNTPLFFLESGHFQQLIPPQPISISEYNDLPLQPLLNSYLSHYNIDFIQQGLAQHHAIWKSDIGDYTIVQQYWKPESAKGNLIIAHGYLDHSGLYGQLIQWALKKQLNVYCFDFPGHGLSSGQRAGIDHFSTYTQVFSQWLKQLPIDANKHSQNTQQKTYNIAIGQSTGCSVISDYLLTEPDTLFNQVFLLAPLVRSYQWKTLRYLYFLCRSFLTSIKRKFIHSSHDAEFNLFVKHSDPLQARRIQLNWLGAMEAWDQKINALMMAKDAEKALPRKMEKAIEKITAKTTAESTTKVTIIQGTGDTTVDWKYNISSLQQCLPNTTALYINNARHHLVKESREYWQLVEQALDEEYPPH